jgi:pilus assembly protein Flp/PilA
MKTFVRLLSNCQGASAAEYALILAIVGSGIALSSIWLGEVVATSINDTGTCIATDGSTCPR